MSGLSTRDALRAAISNAYYDARNAGQTMETAADNAATGVLAVLATLADDEALVERLARGRFTTDYTGTPTAERIRLNIEAKEVRDVLRALVAALAERGEQHG